MLTHEKCIASFMVMMPPRSFNSSVLTMRSSLLRLEVLQQEVTRQLLNDAAKLTAEARVHLQVVFYLHESVTREHKKSLNVRKGTAARSVTQRKKTRSI
jgi:hypothetical protein